MAIKLFSLRNVPLEEADEIRALLSNKHIAFHETPAGFLGIGTAAIWVNDESQYDTARELVSNYQNNRFTQARQQYEEQRASGEHLQFIDMFKRSPVKVGSYIVFSLFLLYLMARPFWF